MTFVWKITCRRLQTSGALVRFADGTVSERERGEIETHLARCPSCQAVVADALVVADLLKTNVPTAPHQSLAASGALWSVLESTIAATPQEKALPVSVRAPQPQFQRFGHWLATPGALPFGAAAAVGVLVMIVLNHRGGVPTEAGKPVSVAAADSAGPAEISLLPSPASPKAMAPAARSAKVFGQVQARSAPAVVAANSDADELQIVPMKNKLALRLSSPVSPHRAAPTIARPSLPRAPIQLARASQSDAAPSAASMLAAPASVAVPAMSVLASPVPSPSVSDVSGGTQPGGAGGLGGGSGPALDRALPPAPAPMQNARIMVAPAPPASSATNAMTSQKTEAFGAMSGSGSNASTYKYKSEETQDAPLGHSLMDMALQQRRKRTLFSYATR